jgi:hypothetical protein
MISENDLKALWAYLQSFTPGAGVCDPNKAGMLSRLIERVDGLAQSIASSVW